MSNHPNDQPLSPSEQALQGMMQRANISSQRALAEKANVSRWQVQQLRQGNIDAMRLTILKQLAVALECSLVELLQSFEPTVPAETDVVKGPADTVGHEQVDLLRQEYVRLEQRLENQAQELQHQFQTEALHTIESWLTYWPTASKVATERNDFDAKKLLPLVKPIERLVANWDVTTIGTIGEQISYDPQQHQLARGMAQPGELVRVSHLGYRHRENLLLRAKVVPINL